MRRIDRDALARCIETMRNSANPADREQIEDKLKAEPWIEAAELAAYSWQFDALRLKPWQSPPCWVDPRDIKATLSAGDHGVGRHYATAKLLQRLLAAGLSRYEPDPIAALERARPAA